MPKSRNNIIVFITCDEIYFSWFHVLNKKKNTIMSYTIMQKNHHYEFTIYLQKSRF